MVFALDVRKVSKKTAMYFLGNTKRTSKFNLHYIEFHNFTAPAAKCGGPLATFEETAYPELAQRAFFEMV